MSNAFGDGFQQGEEAGLAAVDAALETYPDEDTETLKELVMCEADAYSAGFLEAFAKAVNFALKGANHDSGESE